MNVSYVALRKIFVIRRTKILQNRSFERSLFTLCDPAPLVITRSTDDNLTIETPRTKLVTAGDRAFINASPHLWNKLPYALRATDSLETYRLTTHLFKEYFD